jgi:curli production assembly/transport component CsgF
MKKIANVLLGAVMTVTASAAGASELTYRPTNPSFGGNPFNSAHLLGVASAINKYRDPAEIRREAEREAQKGNEFERIIQSSVLSRISSQVSSQIFGEGAAESGQFILGGTSVNFFREGSQTVIDISDSATGDVTRISIPTPQF